MNINHYTVNKIQQIKENQSYGILVEVGLGQPVYNELCMHQNTASKIVMYAESPNSWEHNKVKYNHNDFRAISPEICKRFIDEHWFLPTEPYNFLLTNTIQVANNNTTQTHGWFGMQYNMNIKFYHFTINGCGQDRKHITKLISKIGLDIIASQNDVSKLDNGYIDQILDENFNQLKQETLTSIINGKLNIHNIHNTSVVFTSENKMHRFNDYLRTIKNSKLMLFKGSFNPIHIQHMNLTDSARDALNIENMALCISVYNRDPNKVVDVDNLNKRIMLLNELGYTVIVDCMGEYHYSYTSMINNVDFKNIDLNYIMGSDIAKRFLTDESVYKLNSNKKSIVDFNRKWSKCTFHYANRNDQDLIDLNPELEKFERIDIAYNDISSTVIREHIVNDNMEELKKLIGPELIDLYKKYGFNKQ